MKISRFSFLSGFMLHYITSVDVTYQFARMLPSVQRTPDHTRQVALLDILKKLYRWLKVREHAEDWHEMMVDFERGGDCGAFGLTSELFLFIQEVESHMRQARGSVQRHIRRPVSQANSTSKHLACPLPATREGEGGGFVRHHRAAPSFETALFAWATF
jgi:hypothetical protein